MICRPLYPKRIATADRQRVLVSLAAFLNEYGYWPATSELASMLSADHGAVVWYCKELVELKLCERTSRQAARAYYQLTPRGWQTLGLQPVEPWIKRPKRLLTRVAYKVTLDLAKMLAAQERSFQPGEAEEDCDD